MSGYSAINLANVPAPDIVEALTYEGILAGMVADLKERDPAFTALVESDPAFKVLEVAAYRELLLRQRVNDAARAVMLAHATGADLDNLAALVPLERHVIDPGDTEAVPPVPPTMESDDEFRRRVQLAPEGFSTAGPDGAYIFHALNVPGCRDAAVSSPSPGEVVVHILGREADGTPSETVLTAVTGMLTHDEVRPFTDHVTVQPAGVVPYDISAALHVQDGPSAGVVLAAAQAAAGRFTASRHVLGAGVPISAVHAALHVEGVERVALTAPAADVTVQPHEAAFCTGVTLTVVEEANA